ncbi:hypothetical protein QUF58_12770 [Anaerolineales bacterium HSG24]|nr:hypothetical protein [Anaerolineales bacterium HSG24]
MTQQHLTLKLLIQQIGLTAEEVAQLRLSHLHLAGKEPNISFVPENEDEAKTFLLDLDTHRMLVSWLVARPDSVSDFLFPGDDNGAMIVDDIEAIVIALEKQEKNKPIEEDNLDPVFSFHSDERVFSRPVRPLSRPEVGAPPPGFNLNVSVPVFSPSSAPEMDVDASQTTPKNDDKENEPQPPSDISPKVDDHTTAEETVLPVTEPDLPSAQAKQSIEDIAEDIAIENEVDSPTVLPSSPATPDQTPTEMEMEQSHVQQKKPFPRKQEKKPDTVNSKSNLGRVLFYAISGVTLLFCTFCLVGGALVWQFAPYDEMISLAETEQSTVDATPSVEIIQDSPVPSPTSTPIPTDTPTALPTNTSSPTATNSPEPTFTLEPTATETLVPTDTPVLEPTLTFTPEATPTETPIPTSTPTETPVAPVDTATPEIPTDTPTPVRDFDAPKLLDPDHDSQFIRGNTIILRWEPVGELLENEYYAVRLRHRFQGGVIFSGENVTASEWTIPLDIIDKVDGPDYSFEWFIIVEQDNDGDVRQISPQSETRSFIWR